jgi:glycosyltransferase involved in cell wall biosynthesis
MPSDYILFVSDIFLYRGGVADYTDNFALQLHKYGKLNSVVTPFVENSECSYPVKKFNVRLHRGSFRLDKYWGTRKIASVYHYTKLYTLCLIHLKKLVKGKRATTIIFTEYYTREFDIIIFCARVLKINYVLLFHGLDLIKAKENHKDNLFLHFNHNFSQAEYIIYNSYATEQLAKKLFPNLSNKRLIMHPGIDIQGIEKRKISQKEGEYRTGNDIIFSTISRLVKRKGVDIAIQIVHQLSKSYPSIKYYIGGVGSEKDKLETMVQELNAGSYIFFLDNIDNNAKYNLLAASDFFLLPNHSAGNSDFEGFGISFIEASFFGNVIVGGKQGGAGEAVIDGTTGFLFDFDKPESVEKAVNVVSKYIENPELMESIKQNGIGFVKSNYDWKILIKRFLEFVN